MAAIWTLASAIGVIGANSLVLGPIATDVARSFADSSAGDVLRASASYGLGTAVGALFLAPHADRIGLRRALFRAFAALTLALAASMVAANATMLVLAQAVAGLAAGVALPCIYGLAGELAPARRESETLGRILTGWMLSLVVGVAGAALLSDWIGWRAVYGLLAGCAALLVWRLGLAAWHQPDRRSRAVRSPLRALALPGLVPVLLSVGAYMIAFYGLYAYLGTHLTAVLGVSTAGAGLTALFYGIGFGAIAPLDRLIDRFGAARAGPIAFAALVAAYLFLALVAGSPALILAGCLFWGAANHLGLNILVGRLIRIDPSARGAILGLYGAVTYAAMFVGTMAFLPAFETHGFAFLACLSAGCIVPALLHAVMFRLRQVDEQARR